MAGRGVAFGSVFIQLKRGYEDSQVQYLSWNK